MSRSPTSRRLNFRWKSEQCKIDSANMQQEVTNAIEHFGELLILSSRLNKTRKGLWVHLYVRLNTSPHTTTKKSSLILHWFNPNPNTFLTTNAATLSNNHSYKFTKIMRQVKEKCSTGIINPENKSGNKNWISCISCSTCISLTLLMGEIPDTVNGKSIDLNITARLKKNNMEKNAYINQKSCISSFSTNRC